MGLEPTILSQKILLMISPHHWMVKFCLSVMLSEARTDMTVLHSMLKYSCMHVRVLINPRRLCRRVTVVILCVCLHDLLIR